jgi:hypothetical protein
MKLQRLRKIGFAAMALALAACTTQTGQGTSPTTSTPAEPTTVAVSVARSDFPASGPVEAGTYRIPASAWSVADVTMTLPEGWETQLDYPGAFKAPDGHTEFFFVLVDSVYSDPCVGSGGEPGIEEVGPGVDDLAQALLAQPHTVATGPVETTLGGLPAQRIDLTMEDDPETATCNSQVPGNLQIWHSRPTDSYFVLLGDGNASVYILEVNGERQVLLTQHQAEATDEELDQLQAIIESIEIDADLSS